MVTWESQDAVGGDDDAADTKPGEGKLAITVNAGGTPVALARDVAATRAIDETNFVEGIGVGGFAEFHIAMDPETGIRPRTRVLVFTDKEQAAAPTSASTVRFANRVPIASRVTNLITVGEGDTAITTGDYDHDGNSRSDPIQVIFSCPASASCEAVEDADGSITISGYRISTEAGGAEVMAEDEADDTTYLAFGVWLTETGDTGVPVYTFGAFHGGGAPVTDLAAGVTGKATYKGSAAGLHTRPSVTNFFHADATLNADFGAADEFGKVTGMIHNIVSGGESVSGNIHLDVTPVTTTDGDGVTTTAAPDNIAVGGMNGRARMGTAGADPVSGVPLYPYNGTWSAQFYNRATDRPDTAANEALNAPASVAGTFGVERTDRMGTLDDAADDETSSFVGAFGAHK